MPGAARRSGEGWFPEVSHDLGTLQEEQPKDLPPVCETLSLFPGFYIEKALCCKYLALLPERRPILKFGDGCSDAQGVWTRAVKIPASIA